MALETADAVAPALTLGGVLIGLLVTGRRQDMQWRRERRTEVYAAVLTAAGDVAHELSRVQSRYADEDVQPLDWDYISELTQPLRAACDLALLYAGSTVTLRLFAVQREAGRFADQTPAEMDMGALALAMNALQWDMRLELRSGSWPVRVIAAVRAFRESRAARPA